MTAFNTIANSISELYRPDNRPGDSLLQSQRGVNREWRQIISPPRRLNSFTQWMQRTPLRNKIVDVVSRIIHIVSLIIPTILAYGLGLVGVLIKACYPTPVIPPLPSYQQLIRAGSPPQEPLQTLSTRALSNALANNMNLANPMHRNLFNYGSEFLDRRDQINLSVAIRGGVAPQERVQSISTRVLMPALVSNTIFADRLYDDLFNYLGSEFLETRDLIGLSATSRGTYQRMRSPIIWQPILHEYRIWGATKYVLQHIRRNNQAPGYALVPVNALPKIHPMDQLRAYHRILMENEGSQKNQVFDYLARLMVGGPLAFYEIPKLSPADATSLQVEDMPASIIRGVDAKNKVFFAMLVRDRTSLIPTPEVLVFVNQGENGRINDSWLQVANGVWGPNEVKIQEQNDLNYILALFRREDLTTRNDITSAKLKASIEIVEV